MRAFVFDAYGTLFDVHSFDLHSFDVHSTPRGEALSHLWRQKQVEYTWRRTLMRRYQDFWHVTEEALRAAAAQLRIELDERQIEALMQAYLAPPAFAEVRAALDALKSSPLAILSNGSPRMLEAAVQANRLESYFDHILSVDGIATYKPSPAVYALGPEALQIPAGEMLFVSANAWDAAGAKAYGYQVCWCNRSGAPMDALGFEPDFTVERLDQIAAALSLRNA
jgi:2-haloacid dehalogenase